MYKVIFWLLRVTREAPWLLHWWLPVDPFMLFIDTDITRQSHEADSCTRPFKHTVRTYPYNPVASSISDINIQHKRLLYWFINTDVSFWQHHALIMSSKNFIFAWYMGSHVSVLPSEYSLAFSGYFGNKWPERSSHETHRFYFFTFNEQQSLKAHLPESYCPFLLVVAV